jgi:hypothetical protein
MIDCSDKGSYSITEKRRVWQKTYRSKLSDNALAEIHNCLPQVCHVYLAISVLRLLNPQARQTTNLHRTSMEYAVLRDIIVLLALSVLTVTAFRRLYLPPIVGYLFVGAVAGPSALGWLKDTEATRFLGEIGVIFLLFMLGLELPVSQLNRIKGPLLGLGGTQVLIGTLSGAAIAWAIGAVWQGAIILGGALAMSSGTHYARGKHWPC